MLSYERAEEYTTIYIIVCLLIVFNPTTSIKPVLYYYLDLSTSDDQSLLNCHHEEGGAKINGGVMYSVRGSGRDKRREKQT